MGIRYDLPPGEEGPRLGDLLVTPAGSAYQVLTCRPVRHRRPRPLQGWCIRAERVAVGVAGPPWGRRWPLHWYRRLRTLG